MLVLMGKHPLTIPLRSSLDRKCHQQSKSWKEENRSDVDYWLLSSSSVSLSRSHLLQACISIASVGATQIILEHEKMKSIVERKKKKVAWQSFGDVGNKPVRDIEVVAQFKEIDVG